MQYKPEDYERWYTAMIKCAVAIYDMQTGIYESPMVFDDYEVAFASIRRYTRDMYINKQMTVDAMKDQQLRHIGYYDTIVGQIYNSEEDEHPPIRLSNFVYDLVGDSNEV